MYARPAAVLRQDRPARQTSTSSLVRVDSGARRADPGAIYGCERAAELLRATASGSSRATSTRPSASSTTGSAGARAEQSRPAAGEGRPARSRSIDRPLVTAFTSDHPERQPRARALDPSGTWRTGGSRSSPRRGDRRLAPRGRGSGRSARADAEARRHARLSPARPRAPLSQRPAHELRPRRPRAGSRRFCRRLSRSVPTSRSRKASSRGSTSRGGDHSR